MVHSKQPFRLFNLGALLLAIAAAARMDAAQVDNHAIRAVDCPVAVDAMGNQYLAGPTLRKMTPAEVRADLIMLTQAVGPDDRVDHNTRPDAPPEVIADPSGCLYVTINPTARQGRLAGAPGVTPPSQTVGVTAANSGQFSVAAASDGGGSMAGWFAAALLILGLARKRL